MQKLDLKPHYDVVIIGAGVGGLTAAALLSKAGFSVCVLEKEPHAGGYLAGFRRKHFRFDTAIHWLNQYNPGGMVCRIFDILGDDYPRAIRQKKIRRYKGDNFDYLLTDNPDDLKEQWIREFPHEKDGIERFFKVAKKLGAAFNDFGTIFRAGETMTKMEQLRGLKKLLKFAMAFIPYIRFTGEKGIRKGLSKFFKDDRLQRVFSGDGELLSCLVPIGWAYYGDYQSPPKGGGQVIPEWLLHVIGFYKNEAYFKCNVREVLVEHNTAKGVRFEHRGAEYTVNSKYVVAACDVETLYDKMLPKNTISDKFRQKLGNAVLYSSSVTISVALDCPTEDLGLGEELIHLSSELVPREEHAGGDPEKSEISILPPSLRDKSLAPEGCGTLTIFMPAYMDHYNQWYTEKDEHGNPLRGEAYKKLKEDIADVLIRRVEEKVIPGLRSHILFYDVATPVTHWRYTGNKNGTMMGSKPGRANMQAKVAHYQTPVRNLLLSGHWAELGGGVPIAVKAAANTCLLIFKKEKKEIFQGMADYMDEKITAGQLLQKDFFIPYDNSWVQEPTPAQKLALRTKEAEKPQADQ